MAGVKAKWQQCENVKRTSIQAVHAASARQARTHPPQARDARRAHDRVGHVRTERLDVCLRQTPSRRNVTSTLTTASANARTKLTFERQRRQAARRARRRRKSCNVVGAQVSVSCRATIESQNGVPAKTTWVRLTEQRRFFETVALRDVGAQAIERLASVFRCARARRCEFA